MIPEPRQAVPSLAGDLKINPEHYAALVNNPESLPALKAGSENNARIIDKGVVG